MKDNLIKMKELLKEKIKSKKDPDSERREAERKKIKINKYRGAERREEERKKIKINKIFSAAMISKDKSPINCFVYIKDISKKGIRVNIDFPCLIKDIFELKIFLNEPLELKVRCIWQRRLLGGMYDVGLEFVGISPENISKINDFINVYSLGEQEAFYLNYVLSIDANAENFSESFYTLSNELSIKGMRITYDKKFPENTEIELKISLEFDEEPIKLKAKVAWQKKVFLGNYIVGLEFTKISKEDILKIKRLID